MELSSQLRFSQECTTKLSIFGSDSFQSATVDQTPAIEDQFSNDFSLDKSASDLMMVKPVTFGVEPYPDQRLQTNVLDAQSIEYSQWCASTSAEELQIYPDGLTGEMEDVVDEHGMFMSSVVKKRRKKMNKHKYKKRRKRDRARHI